MAYLSQLRTFVAAYRLGSLSKAASYLEITQPAASQHICLLENHIQKPLFVRHARGIVPTVVAHDLARANGELSYLYKPNIPPTNSLYLVWHRDKLSHPCVAFARQYFLSEEDSFNRSWG